MRRRDVRCDSACESVIGRSRAVRSSCHTSSRADGRPRASLLSLLVRKGESVLTTDEDREMLLCPRSMRRAARPSSVSTGASITQPSRFAASFSSSSPRLALSLLVPPLKVDRTGFVALAATLSTTPSTPRAQAARPRPPPLVLALAPSSPAPTLSTAQRRPPCSATSPSSPSWRRRSSLRTSSSSTRRVSRPLTSSRSPPPACDEAGWVVRMAWPARAAAKSHGSSRWSSRARRVGWRGRCRASQASS